MYPLIDFGFGIVSSFQVAKGVMVVAAAVVFAVGWRERMDTTSRSWGIAAGAFIAALVAAKSGTSGWMVLRPAALGLVADVSPRWVQAGSEWLFAGLLCSIGGTAMVLAGTGTSVLDGLDALAPGLALAQAIHRMGCFLAGDGCYGSATDLPWGVAFPKGSVPASVPVHPTMLYEGLLMLAIFGGLWYWRHQVPRGMAIALFLAGTSVVCFVTHFWMIDPPIVAGLTETQLWSLLVFPLSAAAVVGASR